MLRLLVLMWAMTVGAAFAQTTTGSVNPNAPAPQPAAKDDVPPGGCMPMGVTASGEIVFPLECKAFLDQHRGNDPRSPPAAAETKPAVDPQPPLAAKPPANDPPAAQPPVAAAQKSAAREEQPVEKKQPEPPAEKPAEAAVPKPTEAQSAKEPETTTAAKEPETPAAKEPESPAAKQAEAPAAKQSDATPSDDSRDRPAKPASLSRRAENTPRARTSHSPDCTNYRSYDSSSGTYRDYSGHIRPCR